LIILRCFLRFDWSGISTPTGWLTLSGGKAIWHQKKVNTHPSVFNREKCKSRVKIIIASGQWSVCKSRWSRKLYVRKRKTWFRYAIYFYEHNCVRMLFTRRCSRSKTHPLEQAPI
jgi:hypothetical protein